MRRRGHPWRRKLRNRRLRRKAAPTAPPPRRRGARRNASARHSDNENCDNGASEASGVNPGENGGPNFHNQRREEAANHFGGFFSPDGECSGTPCGPAISKRHCTLNKRADEQRRPDKIRTLLLRQRRKDKLFENPMETSRSSHRNTWKA